MRALVFGANGQDGPYLVEALGAKGIEAVGVSRAGPWRRGDVGDRADVEAAVREVRPGYIFQLAASSTTRHEALYDNHAAIATGALNVLESARLHAPEARVFLAGSGLQFENVGEPIDESAPFEAGSPYALARIQSVYAARYFRTRGLRTYVGYLFHHDSPRRGPRHVAQLIAQAARRIAAGGDEVLELADTSVVKEWAFAGDVARAMVALVGQDEITEAVIGTGEGHTIQDWVERCFALAGRDWRDHLRVAPGGRGEYPRLVSRPARLMSLGWRPEVSFARLAEMMMAAQLTT
ncbi:MAG TPA: GDP-mannose 4,6-dehydratase [Polyangia bacterium]|nr:GDP-mannose 4,6-dehydratase [Polyangia bacterium]